jgi:hypothetical protein
VQSRFSHNAILWLYSSFPHVPDCTLYIYDVSKIGTVCYFFFDTTMGWQTTLSLIVLLVILTLFYGFFAMADSLLEFGWVGNGSYYSGASLGMSISRLKEFLPMGVR